jgi:hypothetical protein
MTELENHTLHLLRKMDRNILELRGEMAEIRNKIDSNYHKHQKRLNGLQLAIQGGGFSDRCVVAKLDERISALEKRASRPRRLK